jgi:hypothetical protein
VASEVGGYSAEGTIGLYQSSGTLNSSYNDVWANDTNWSGCSSGEGDISADPQFVDAANNDFHLQATSPCIDAGTPEGTDMGRYDYVPSALSVVLRNYDDTADYTTWEVGTGKALNTVYIMSTTECVLVKNNGGVNEDFGISASASSWTLGSTNEGENQCVLMGLFNGDNQPSEEAYSTANDLITGTNTWATYAPDGTGKFQGTNSGVNVAPNSGEKLYVYLKTPASVTSGAEELITVTITCKEH